MRRAGQITAHLCVAPQLPTDRRRAATKLGGDRPHRHAHRTQKPKLFPLGEGQTPALQTTAPTWTNAPVGDHPPRALLAIRPCRNRGVADELATLQLGPEDLHVLGDHVISEPDDQHLNSAGVAITARTQGTTSGTQRRSGEAATALTVQRRESILRGLVRPRRRGSRLPQLHDLPARRVPRRRRPAQHRRPRPTTASPNLRSKSRPRALVWAGGSMGL